MKYGEEVGKSSVWGRGGNFVIENTGHMVGLHEQGIWTVLVNFSVAWVKGISGKPASAESEKRAYLYVPEQLGPHTLRYILGEMFPEELCFRALL
jgi:hypothetical protein